MLDCADGSQQAGNFTVDLGVLYRKGFFLPKRGVHVGHFLLQVQSSLLQSRVHDPYFTSPPFFKVNVSEVGFGPSLHCWLSSSVAEGKFF